MSGISYFQRFSQRENHATNNTLLMLRHFYQHSPRKLNLVLSSLLDSEELDVGLIFEQQKKGTDSVPDATITQRAIEVHLETKRDGRLDKKQIRNHISTIQNSPQIGGQRILFGLTRSPISENDRKELRELAKKAAVTFRSITFAEVVDALRDACASHETELLDIVLDYESYLTSENLVQIGEIMTAVACTNSMEENRAFRLYYEPAHRSAKLRSKFIGLYTNKEIRYVGEVDKVVVGKIENGKFVTVQIEKGKINDDDMPRILGAIEASHYYPELGEMETRYYLFNAFQETSFVKNSKGGLFGTKHLNLKDWLQYENASKTYDAASAAILLRGKKWE